MKKISLLVAGFAMVFGASAQADMSPNPISKTNINSNKALWTVQLDVPPTNIAAGLAAVCWTGTEFWVSDWRTSTATPFSTADQFGAQTGSAFAVSGVSGCRSLTTDGTSLYAGTNSTMIHIIDPNTKTKTGQINTSVPNIRYCAYDPTLNSNAGGFWVGAWATNITAVSMTGATLTTIPNGGLSGVYGLAYDPYSSGGPYLWAFDQGVGPSQSHIVQLTMGGVQTGLVHDCMQDLPTVTTAQGGGIAGGLGIVNNFVPGKNSIIGISQGASLFAYELADPFAIDMQMDAVNISPYILAGSSTVSGTIRNVGLTTITSVDISWDNGSGPNSQTFSVNIPANGTYNFTHGTQMTTTAGQAYNVCVSVTTTGDMQVSNDTMCLNTTALATIPTKYVVGEEKTGTWCGWCPRGAVGLANMEAQSDFIGIAVHNGSSDPMLVPAYDSGIQTYIPGGYPGGGVDRVYTGDPSAANLLAMHNARKTAVVPCDVNNIVATYNTQSGMIDVSANSQWFGAVTGNFRLSCVIVEDNVIGSGAGWNQANYYGAGGSGGPGGVNDAGSMAFPPTVNGGFSFYGASTSVAPSLYGGYDHVARSLSNNAILGDVGSLPANPAVGNYSWNFAAIPNSTINNAADAYAVVMIVDVSNGEILNAGKANLSTINSMDELETAKFKLNVYPNPTSDVATISYNLPEAGLVSMEVYNTMGSMVFNRGTESMGAGTHIVNFDGSDLPSGIYFVNLTVDNQVITKKVSIRK